MTVLLATPGPCGGTCSLRARKGVSVECERGSSPEPSNLGLEFQDSPSEQGQALDQDLTWQYFCCVLFCVLYCFDFETGSHLQPWQA